MRRRVVFVPDRVLKSKAQPIDKVDDDIKQLAEDMLETMYLNKGIGLAANQVGVLKRIFVMDVAQREGNKEPMVLINPEITWTSEEQETKEEGCLSIPGYFGDVTRPAGIKVKYLTLEGKEEERECTGWESACVQHEIDHLDGILFTDHLSKLRRDIILKKMKKDKPRLEHQQDHAMEGTTCNH